MARKIVITSGKGGAGKTSIAGNLGVALGNLGKRTCIVDADFKLNNLDVMLGVENSVVYDIVDCLEGKCRLKQALIQMPTSKNAYVLPSVNAFVERDIPTENLRDLIEGLDRHFDFILIDCPAGVDYGFHTAVSVSDEALVITTPQIASLRDADKVFTKLKNYSLKAVGLIVNKVRGDLILSGLTLSPEDIVSALKVDLTGIIPDDDKMFLYNAGYLPKNSESGKAFKILANSLVYGKRKTYDYTKNYSGFFGTIKREIKRSI